MALDWSEQIAIAQLTDEPSLSDDLATLIERTGSADRARPMPHVVLNFGEVSHINSSNIAQLLRLRQHLSKHGRRLKLCSVSQSVWEIFAITGLDKVFHFTSDPLTALTSLQLEDAEQGSG